MKTTTCISRIEAPVTSGSATAPRSVKTSTGTLAAVLLAATLALPMGSQAQQSMSANPAATQATRGGLHFSLGLGSGSVAVTCAGCNTNFFEDRLNGLSGVVQLGGFLNPQLALTAEFIAWMNNDDLGDRRVAGMGVALLGYPSPTSGFFVKGGLGGIRAIGENDVLIVQSDAWMATTGIGYDISVGDGVGITAYANYVRSFGAGTWVNGFSSDFVATPNVLQFGAALTVH